MTNDEGLKPEGAPERSPNAGAGAPSGVDGNGPKRFSVQRKMAIVARLLRGEPLDLVARQMNVSVARLACAWAKDLAPYQSPTFRSIEISARKDGDAEDDMIVIHT